MSPGDPGNAANLRARGLALVEMGRHHDALPILHQAAARAPGDPTPWCLIAACHLKLEEPQLALEAAERAIVASPGISWGHRVRALALGALNRAADAEAAAKEAVRWAPASPVELRVLAECQCKANHTGLAEHTADRLRELAPSDAASWVTSSYVALSAKQASEARRFALEALRLDPTNSAALNNLGMAYRNQYRFIRALQCFVHSWKLAPQSSQARRNIAAAIASIAVLTAIATVQLAIHGAGIAALLLPVVVAVAAWRGLRGLPAPAMRVVGREIVRLPKTGFRLSPRATWRVLVARIALMVSFPLWVYWAVTLMVDVTRRTRLKTIPAVEICFSLFCAYVAFLSGRRIIRTVRGSKLTTRRRPD